MIARAPSAEGARAVGGRVAKRRKDDEPDRPYRWSDTPFDPLASPGRGGVSAMAPQPKEMPQ